MVVAVAAALLVTVISLLVAGVAQATNDGPSARAARQNLVQVVVRPGQSLWSVAESADPDQDTRAVVQQIIDLNSLNGDTVFAGQQLWVPAAEAAARAAPSPRRLRTRQAATRRRAVRSGTAAGIFRSAPRSRLPPCRPVVYRNHNI